MNELQFRPLTLQDAEYLRTWFSREPKQLCDYSVGGILLWRDLYHYECAEDCGTLFIRQYDEEEDEAPSYLRPVSANLTESLTKLDQYCRSHDLPFRLSRIPEEDLPVIRTLFPEAVCSSDRDVSDYFYAVETFRTYAGHHLSGQRNHVHQFLRNYPDFRLEPVSSGNRDDVLAFLEKFYRERENENDPSVVEDKAKTFEMIRNLDVYNWQTLALRVDGTVIALSCGEVLGETLFVHIEKADTEYAGSYPFIAQEFAKYCQDPAIRFINREDDVGNPGLRRSKLAYAPIKLLAKYHVVVR